MASAAPVSALDDLIEKYRGQHPAAPSPGNPFDDLIPRYAPPSAQTPGAGRTLSALDALMAEHAAKAQPQRGGISPDNPFDGLIAQPLPPTPTSGVTIAPKGGMAREATPEETSTLNPGASLADVASTAGANLIPSAQRFGSDIWDAVSDPRQTARSLKNVAFGAAEKLVPGEQSHEKYADAVGQFFANRYGGMDAFKKTLAEDPVGFAADLATLLSGGELALARAPGVIGTVARAAGIVGRAVDPINASLKAAGTVAKGVGHIGAAIGGVTTGVGGQALRTAARTGFEGGEAGAAFRDSMRGNVPMEDVITEAKSALGNIKQARSAAYNAGMTGVKADTKVLDFSKIDQAVQNAQRVKTFKGVSLSPSTDATMQELTKVVNQWRTFDPNEFHTAAGKSQSRILA